MLKKFILIIIVSELYSPRAQLECEYHLKVYLLSKDLKLIDSFLHDETVYSSHELDWKLIKHTFCSKSYNNAVRYIIYCHSGKVNLIF
jgi:hypothetical protein